MCVCLQEVHSVLKLNLTFTEYRELVMQTQCVNPAQSKKQCGFSQGTAQLKRIQNMMRRQRKVHTLEYFFFKPFSAEVFESYNLLICYSMNSKKKTMKMG